MPHGGPVPHRHWPAVHESEWLSQATQIVLDPPQAAVVLPATQLLPLQQPVVQVEVVQTQVPASQPLPEGQELPAPQWQVPPLQLLAPMPHEAQAAPLVPQAL